MNLSLSAEQDARDHCRCTPLLFIVRRENVFFDASSRYERVDLHSLGLPDAANASLNLPVYRRVEGTFPFSAGFRELS